MKKITKIFLSIFYIGYINFAPGTWASLASIIIMFLFFELLSIPLLISIFFFIALFFISVFLINYFSSFDNSKDSKHIVIDELLGIYTIFFFYEFIYIYNHIITLILIFLFFRFFDIIKIFPANFIDQKFKNGYGVILDDIIAAIYTILTLVILNVFI